MLKNQTHKKHLFLVLFFVACAFELYSVGYNNNDLLIFSRISLIAFLLIFYSYSVKEINKTLIFTLFSFLLSDILFSTLSTNLYGMVGLVITRIALVKLVLTNTKKIDWKVFSIAVSFFLIIAVIILSLFYEDSFFYYWSLVTTLFLIIFSSFAFMNLVKANRISDVLMFVGASFFIVSDAVFGANKFEQAGHLYTVLSSLFYDAAFFLICLSVIKRDDKKKFRGIKKSK